MTSLIDGRTASTTGSPPDATTEGFLRSSHGHTILQGLEVVGGYEGGGPESDGEVDGA